MKTEKRFTKRIAMNPLPKIKRTENKSKIVFATIARENASARI